MKNKALQQLNEVWENGNKVENPTQLNHPVDIASKIANLFASGKYFYFTMNFELMDIDYVSDEAEIYSNIPNKKFNLKSWTDNWHPSDLEKVSKQEQCKVQFLFNFIKPEEIPNYKVCQKYRYLQNDGTYKLYLNSATTLVMSKEMKIQKTLLVQTDISHLETVNSDRVSFIHLNGGPSYYSDDLETFIEEKNEKVSFSERELEILSLISKGYSSQEVSEKIFISKSTVDTHKRNIIGKTNCKNIVEVVSESIRKGWI